MASATTQVRTTTDHQAIRSWAEQRGGRPATVAGTGAGAGGAGVLRIHFPDAGHDSQLFDIEWDAFFAAFDEGQLAFVYQEQTDDGSTSRFAMFVSRHPR